MINNFSCERAWKITVPLGESFLSLKEKEKKRDRERKKKEKSGTPEPSKSQLTEIKCSIKAFKTWSLKFFYNLWNHNVT